MSADCCPPKKLSVEHCVAGEGTVGAEAKEILGVEIEVNRGDEQISLCSVSLAAVAIRSFTGHDGMRRPEVELMLAAKEERRIECVSERSTTLVSHATRSS